MTPFASRLCEHRLLAILRGTRLGHLDFLTDIFRRTHIRFIEVTLNTPEAASQIDRLRQLLGAHAEIGAGTVLDVDAAKLAVDAGAQYLVSPCLVPEVQDWALKHQIPTLPGALTPTEIWKAYRCGADMVKIFPARSAGGPAYFRELRGPYADTPLLACGGVSVDTAKEYLSAGANALAFGGSIFSKENLDSENFTKIETAISALATSIRLQ